MNSLIMDVQYGDTGKGRVASWLLQKNKYDWAVRFNGGANAGHTIVKNSITHKLHQIPCGALYGVKSAIDTGTVLDLHKLEKEIKENNIDKNLLYISNNVNLITEKHLEQDKDGSGIGTTKSGIAYAYSDRALKRGIRVGNVSSLQEDYNTYSGLVPFKENENILFESAQGIMLDVDYGVHPFTTSSSVFPSSVYNIAEKIAVMKPYITRVGEGPPHFEDVPELREIGQEYGATTGRPRKCCWIILDELKYALQITKPHKLVMTKVDIIKKMNKVGVWDNNKLIEFKPDDLINYLVDKFKITHISDSPDGDILEL